MKMESSLQHESKGGALNTSAKTASPVDMEGAVLPGNSTVELRPFPVPEPGLGQVLLRMKASTICGSDIRAI